MNLQVEVCFSPVLYPYKLIKKDFVAVVVDILRASTSICAALHYGIREIIPVSGIDEARIYKEKGYLVACESNGNTLDFADIGNSPSDFLRKSFKDKTIAFSTTNGTKVIKMAQQDADMVVVGSFINLSALGKYLASQNKDVVILCAAWKNLFNLEDSIFAGALAQHLIAAGFTTPCDSAKASIDLWAKAKTGLGEYLSKSSHRDRLKHLISDEDYEFTVRLNVTKVVPVLENGRLVRNSTIQDSIVNR